MTDSTETWDALATEDQRKASEAAGLAELEKALERRSEDERAAFWAAVGLYYAINPDED